MLEQCKTCLWYDEGIDEIYREGDDEMPLDGSIPDNHFCEEWEKNENVIPKEIWQDKVKCPHYYKDPLIK